ncbi:hypothetical protein J5N97_008520 [Dioscorea zingiberensis]|uniref:Syntaxin 6/10/61 N-terminal domain-containing protein n=1 Tax=Dioscorea zingiberensis TaxID=325984 RepID=A0A9D5HKR3_9LILI|nr:hypothetical protein J5N97_008520 [Dioscorea zingiberensis]
METCFDQWEKDPFFAAAEEVQESSDRVESVYRQWVHESELRRELCAALGTAKWQLDELERAMMANDESCSAGKETRNRHNQFVDAIGIRIKMVENALKKSNFEGDWVRLDEEERDELALFLSCQLPLRGKSLELNGEADKGFLRKEGRVNGHQRLSASNIDTDAWRISISSSEDNQSNVPSRRIPLLSCSLTVLQLSSKVKWSRNVFRKWKGGHQCNDEESSLLRSHHLSPVIDACCERSESFLSSCTHETYDKQLNGWVGFLHRYLQRSQYQIQYGRPMQMTFWIILIVLLVAALAFSAARGC